MTRTCLILLLGSTLAGAEPCHTVEGDRILAGDLARVIPAFAALPAARPLAHAPVAGVQRILKRSQLDRLAKQNGLSATGVGAVCFKRASEMLTPERVLEELHRALAEPEAAIELIDYSRRPVPNGTLQFSLRGLSSPSSSDPTQPVLWRGTVRSEGGRSVSVWARVRVSAPRRQVVALRDLSPGVLITRGDVSAVTVEAFPTGEKSLVDAEAVAGAVPRRRIRAGEAIRAAWLKRPHEVERGDLVRVEVLSGAARLLFEARAESTGRLGDAVWVRNPSSGQRFQARVEEKGKVVVRVGGRSSS